MRIETYIHVLVYVGSIERAVIMLLLLIHPTIMSDLKAPGEDYLCELTRWRFVVKIDPAGT